MKECIIIPTYNERENIESLIPFIFSLLPQIFIMVVDDNSPDGTAAIVKILKETHPNLLLLQRNKKEGLGRAYSHAFQEVLKEPGVNKIIMMDADFSHHPDFLPSMLEASNYNDVVVGSRYASGGKTIGWELWRKILSKGANFYCRLITGLPVKDCTSGFNVISVKALRSIDLSKLGLSGYAFLMELKYHLWQAGAKFKEVPIVFKNRVGGESKISSHVISEGVLAPWKMILKK